MTKQEKIILSISGFVLVVITTLVLALKKDVQVTDKATWEKEVARVEDSLKIVEQVKQDSINRVLSYNDSIQIIKVITSEPNSAGGVDLNIIWKNKSNRVIKYARFETKAINAVDDEVGCDIRGTGRWCSVTGPIKPGKIDGYGTYWGCMWYNSTIKRAEVATVELEFMDGEIVQFPVK